MCNLVLLDTSSILEDVSIMDSFFAKKWIPIITEVVFSEIDNHKSDNGQVGANAREFIRSTIKTSTAKISKLPNEALVITKDSIFQYEWKGQAYYIINSTKRLRKYHHKNDKIISQTALDYNLSLYTNDVAMRTLAHINGVNIIYEAIDLKKLPPITKPLEIKNVEKNILRENLLGLTLFTDSDFEELKKSYSEESYKTKREEHLKKIEEEREKEKLLNEKNEAAGKIFALALVNIHRFF